VRLRPGVIRLGRSGVIEPRPLPDERPEVSRRQVFIAHRRPDIRMPHRHLDVRRILPFGEPGGHAAVPEVMLMELGREPRALHRSPDYPISRAKNKHVVV
jgi:hypothetical protein